LVKWELVRHQVAIAGRLADAGTGKPVGGATVFITEMPAAFRSLIEARARQHGHAWTAMIERPDRARTAADGIFYFLDLPDGDYTLNASLSSMAKRYGTVQTKATVSHDANGDYKLAFLELALQPTTVRGKISGAGQKTGIVMAEVRMKGSGERAFSDVQGQYVLAGVEPIELKKPGARGVITKRTVQVFAQGYRPASKQVAINKAGALETLNFELVREAG
jgi:hypothetical protein